MTLLLPFKTVSKAAGEIIFEDDFAGNAGSAPNSANWTVVDETGLNFNAAADEYYRAANVDLDGSGNLRIKTKLETFGGQPYTSGRVTSKSKVYVGPYGRIEARIKLPAGSNDSGLWPAFWMMGDEEYYGQWPRNGEIDIIETYNDAKKAFFAVHGPTEANQSNQWVVEKSWAPGYALSDDFHIYAMEWTPDKCYFLIDGVVIQTIVRTADMPAGNIWVFNDRHAYININVAVGGSTLVDTPDGTIPAGGVDMLVDYVRYRTNSAALPTLPKTETITSRFDEEEEFSVGGSVTTSGGTLNIPVSNSYYASESRKTDFTNSSIYCTFAQTPNTGNGSTEQLFQVQEFGATQRVMGWKWANGNIVPVQTINTGSEVAGTPLAYNATTHKFLRLRHASGNMYWDYSADTATWTNYQTTAITYGSVAFDNAKVNLVSGYWGTEPSPGTAKFDDVNSPPLTVKSASDTGSLAVSESATPVHPKSSSESISIAVSETVSLSGPPKVETLSETFDNLNGWSQPGSWTAPSIVNGRVRIPAYAWNNHGVQSNETYMLADSSAYIQFWTIDTGDTNSYTEGTFGLGRTPTFNSSLNDWVVNWNFYHDWTTWPVLQVAIGETVYHTVDYNSTDHQWLRIRHQASNDTLYWDTSADGYNWTNHYSMVRPSTVNVYGNRVILRGFDGTDSGALSAAIEFDNLNVSQVTSKSASETRSLAINEAVDIVGQPKISTFTSDFSSSTGWDTTAGTPVFNGTLDLDPSDVPGVRSSGHYEFTETSATIELIQPALAEAGSEDLALTVFSLFRSSYDAHVERFIVEHDETGGAVVLNARHNGNQLASATYNSVQHRWLKIRHAGSTVYFEVSADGSAWNSFASSASTNGVGTWKTELFANADSNLTPAQHAIFDNYNLGPTSTPKAGSESNSLAVSETASVAISSSTTDTGSIAVSETSSIANSSSTTDTGALAVSETSSVSSTASITDTSSIAVTETSNVYVLTPGTDEAGIGVVEQATVSITSSTTDTGSLAVGETSATDIPTASTDTGSIAVSETSAIETTSSTTDTTAWAISETATLNVSVSTTDTAALSIDETQNSSLTVATSDTSAVSVDESVQIFVTFSTTDTGGISVSDSSTTENSSASTDTDSLAVSESVVIQTSLTATESNAVAVAESVTTETYSSDTDTGSIAVAETTTSSITVTTTDTGALAVDETTDSSITVASSDEAAVSISDISNIDSTLPANESIAISVTESAVLDVTVSSTDTGSLAASETASIYQVTAATDTGAITVSEETSSDLTVATSDTGSVISTETTSGSVTASADDEAAITLSETSASALSLSRTDEGGIEVSESTSGSNTVSASESNTLELSDYGFPVLYTTTSDTGSLQIDETTSAEVDASGTDEGSISVIETGVIESTLPGQENVAIGMGESVTIDVTLADDDEAALAVSEDVTRDLYFGDDDSGSLAVSETASTAVSESTSDSSALAVSETSSFYKEIFLTSTDEDALAASETTSFTREIAGTDDSALTLTETPAIFTTSSAAETNSLEVTETTTGEVSATDTDTGSLTVIDASNTDTGSPASDSIAVALGDQSSVFVNLTGSDGLSVALSEASDPWTYSSATDEAALALDDASETLVSFADNDTSALSASEDDETDTTSSANDTSALAVDESTAVYKQLTADDTGYLAIDETSQPDTSAPAAETIGMGIVEESDTQSTGTSSDATSLSADESSVVEVFVTTTDATTVDASETIDSAITVDDTDEGAIAVYDISNLDSDAPTSETISVGVTEQSVTEVTVSGADGAAIELSESAQIFVTSASDDQAEVGLSDTGVKDNSLNGADQSALSVDEQATLFIDRTIAGTDEAAIAVVDNSNVFVDAPGHDNLSLAMDEQSSVLITGVVVLAASDEVSITLSEGANTNVAIDSVDTLDIDTSETSTGAVTGTTADTAGLTVTETRAIASTTTSTDGNGLRIQESASIAVYGAAYGESLDIVVTEDAMVTPIRIGHDPVVIAVTETSSVAVSGTVLKTSDDGLLIGLAEEYGYSVRLNRPDQAALSISETTSAYVTFTVTDTGELAITEVSTRPVFGFDDSVVSVVDIGSLDIDENLRTKSSADSITFGLVEHSTKWVFGERHIPIRFGSGSMDDIRFASSNVRDTINVTKEGTEKVVFFSTSRRGFRIE